jgi:hypothetical protein
VRIKEGGGCTVNGDKTSTDLPAVFLPIIVPDEDQEGGEEIDDADDDGELRGISCGDPFLAEPESVSFSLSLVSQDHRTSSEGDDSTGSPAHDWTTQRERGAVLNRHVVSVAGEAAPRRRFRPAARRLTILVDLREPTTLELRMQVRLVAFLRQAVDR